MKITTTTGPRGRGTYVHTCQNRTFCAEAGGIGDGCGGTTEFTSDMITHADGYGNWHSEAENESDAFFAIWEELSIRGEAADDYVLILERCKVHAGCWTEVAE